MLAVDTNIVLRYLVKDDAAQSARARDIVESAPIFVSLTVVLECEWVLRSLYLPIYVMGVIYVRTALWGIAVIGLLMMLGRLAFAS